MLDGPVITAEQFVETRHNLDDNGQWAELHSGLVTLFQPPDLDHGNTVLNLSKALASYVQEHQYGYPCFDLGLLMERAPDTIRFPAACYFTSGKRFEETDKAYTDTIPAIVIELASTGDRRNVIPRRIEDYFAWGTNSVWVIDPPEKQIVSIDRNGQEICFSEEENFRCEGLLPQFECAVSELFVEPSWWNAL